MSDNIDDIFDYASQFDGDTSLENTSPGKSTASKKSADPIDEAFAAASSVDNAILSGKPSDIDVTKYSDYLPDGVFEGQDINKMRAQGQSFGEQFTGFLNQAVVGEIIGGTIEGTGYLLDMQENLGFQKGTEDEWGNWFSDIGKAIRETTQEATPIYAEAPGTVDPTDSGWWFSNGVSVASTLSLMLPAAGTVRALSMLGKLGMASKLGKVANSVSKLARSGKDIGRLEAQMLKWGGSGMTQATVSRHMENMMEASGVFEEQYSKYKGSGMSDEEARQHAGTAASATYKADWAMLAMDAVQYLSFSKMLTPNKAIAAGDVAKAANQAAGAKIAGQGMTMSALKGAGGMASEGFEEAYQFVMAEEGKYVGDLMAGMTEERAFGDRMDHYLKDGEMWNSVIFGALGGGVFQAASGAVEKGIAGMRGIESSATEQAKARIKNIQDWAPAMREAQKRIREADLTGNLKLMKEARVHSNALMSMKANMSGNAQTHIDFLEHLSGMDEAALEEWNKANPGNELDMDFIKETLPTLIEDSKRITDLYTENINRHEPEVAAQLTQEEFLGESYTKSLAKAEAKLSDIKTKYTVLEKGLSSVGAKEMDLAIEIKKLREYKKQVQYLLDNDMMHPDSRKEVRDNLERAETSIEKLKEVLKEVRKEERTPEEKAADTKIFKSFGTMYDRSKQEAQIKFLEDAIGMSAERADALRNPNKKPSVNQEQAAKMEVNNKMEEMINEAGPNALATFRQTGALPEDVPVLYKGKEGTISWNNTPIYDTRKDDKKDPQPGKKSDYKPIAGVGYIFTDQEGNITPMDLATIKNLYIEPQSVKDQRAYQARRKIFVERYKSLQKVAKELSDELNQVYARIEQGQEVIIGLEAELNAEEQLITDIIKDKSLDKRTKEVKEILKNSRERAAKIREQIKNYQAMREELVSRRDVIESELNFIIEELPRITQDFKEETETSKLTTEQYTKANEDIRKFEGLFNTPEELRGVIQQTDTAIGQIDELIANLEEQLEYMEAISRPVEVAELIANRDTEVAWFEAKYPGHPNKKDIFANLDPKQKSSHLESYLKKHPEFIEDLKKLTVLDVATQREQAEQDKVFAEILGLRKNLIKARRSLRQVIERRDNYIQMYNDFTEAQNITSLYEKLAKEYRSRRNIARKMVADDAKPETDGQIAPTSELPTSQKVDAEIKKKEDESFQFRKQSLNTTAGFHLDKDGDVTGRTMAARWFATLAKLPKITNEEGYHLKVVTMDESLKESGSYLPEAFDVEDKDNNKSGDLKLVLVDKDGNLVKADDKGNINKDGEILATYLHRGKFAESLNKTAVVDKYMKEVLKENAGYKAIKDDKYEYNGKEYTSDDLITAAQNWTAKTQDELRENALEELAAGREVFLEVTSRSSGIPRTLLKDSKGQRPKKKVTDYFRSLDKISTIHVPLTQFLSPNNNSMEEHRVFPGMPYIEDKNGNIIQGIPRNLQEKEIDLIVDVLHYALNGSGTDNFTVKNANDKYKDKPVDIFAKKDGDFAIIPSMIYYGKAKEGNEKGKKHQIFFANNRLYFGESQSIPVQQIDSSPALRSFLVDKHHHISRNRLLKGGVYLQPTSFDNKTGKMDFRAWPEKHGLSGYTQYLLDKQVVSTDILPSNEVQFANTYLNFSYNIKNKTSAPKASVSVTTPVVPTTPKAPAPTTPAPTTPAPTTPTTPAPVSDLIDTDNASVRTHPDGTMVTLLRNMPEGVVTIKAEVKSNKLTAKEVTQNGNKLATTNSQTMLDYINNDTALLEQIVDSTKLTSIKAEAPTAPAPVTTTAALAPTPITPSAGPSNITASVASGKGPIAAAMAQKGATALSSKLNNPKMQAILAAKRAKAADNNGDDNSTKVCNTP